MDICDGKCVLVNDVLWFKYNDEDVYKCYDSIAIDKVKGVFSIHDKVILDSPSDILIEPYFDKIANKTGVKITANVENNNECVVLYIVE